MDLFKDNVIDPTKEVEGVWKLYARGVEVLVARINNPNYRRVLRRKVKAVRASLDQDDDVAMELSDELMQEVYAKTILKDLRISPVDGKLPEIKIDGEAYENGKFTEGLALKLLKNERFRNKIKGFAEDEASYLLFSEEEMGKDSARLSVGT